MITPIEKEIIQETDIAEAIVPTDVAPEEIVAVSPVAKVPHARGGRGRFAAAHNEAAAEGAHHASAASLNK